jgi:hypothetical protein
MIPLAKEVDQACAADSAPFIYYAKNQASLIFAS